MKLNYDYYTDIGTRTNNEDAYYVDEKKKNYIFAVADGLGGHECGEVASLLAINSIKKYFNNNPINMSITRAINEANKIILEEQEKTNKKMKTTLALAWIHGKNITFAHVGDSRIYAFKDNEIIYQSVDHSISQLAVAVGEIELRQIRNHPDRNKLTRAIGVDDTIKIDIYNFSIEQIDAILLCTDGFWEYIMERDMKDTLKNASNSNMWLDKMKKILESVKSNNCDNNTAIAIIER